MASFIAEDLALTKSASSSLSLTNSFGKMGGSITSSLSSFENKVKSGFSSVIGFLPSFLSFGTKSASSFIEIGLMAGGVALYVLSKAVS